MYYIIGVQSYGYILCVACHVLCLHLQSAPDLAAALHRRPWKRVSTSTQGSPPGISEIRYQVSTLKVVQKHRNRHAQRPLDHANGNLEALATAPQLSGLRAMEMQSLG